MFFNSLRRVRQYLRSFYFTAQTRQDFSKQHTYDQMLNDIQLWNMPSIFYSLGTKADVRYFYKIDDRDINLNPFFVFLKSNTSNSLRNDLILYFLILQVVKHDVFMPRTAIIKAVTDVYLYGNDANDAHIVEIDAKRIIKVIEELTSLGILIFRKEGKAFTYRLADACPDLTNALPAIRLFSEISPLGAAGYYLLDRLELNGVNIEQSHIEFKHRHLDHILDSEVLEPVFEAMHKHQAVKVYMAERLGLRKAPNIPDHFTIERCDKVDLRMAIVVPLKIYVSVLSGRRYVMGLFRDSLRLACLRISYIEKAELIPGEIDPAVYKEMQLKFKAIADHVWGVSQKTQTLSHVEMTITANNPESYMLKRLYSECRCGNVEMLSPVSARFSADVYNARELFPWMSSFLGWISDVFFSEPELQEMFIEHIHAIYKNYED